MADLLPPNASAQERALSEAMARLAAVPVPMRDLWNPDTCPAHLLPWLAWALSVDHWDAIWPEERKRAVIKASVEVHRFKGTPAAVERHLEALGFNAVVQEWPEYDGDPYKFKVATDSRFPDAATSDLMYEGIVASKNTRSWLDAIRVTLQSGGNAYVGGLIGRGTHRTVAPRMKLTPSSGAFYAKGGIRRATSRAVGPCSYVPASISGSLYAGGCVRRARLVTVRGSA
jgi:phage tail P2-like protein